jgi:hypothetical protein
MPGIMKMRATCHIVAVITTVLVGVGAAAHEKEAA